MVTANARDELYEALLDRVAAALGEVVGSKQDVNLTALVDEVTGRDPDAIRDLLMEFVVAHARQISDCGWIPGYAAALQQANELAAAAYARAMFALDATVTIREVTGESTDGPIGDWFPPQDGAA